ncbi:MAG TPA: SUMF1/EgtB/PvdO family nonheme iron enzyme [Vicinamibacteria bacterium]|jgi:sulfatase modifying factor 1|nr:SUMF1/EgtB/PvdO family nonheme iron enzyme [Vicinamibacteria bacterium]
MAIASLPRPGRSPLAPSTALVPAGRFRMGSDDGRDDERPVHEVEVPAFHIGRTPVTTLAYARFLAGGRVEAPPWWSDPAFWAPEQPVVGVSWFDATGYCSWLSRTVGGRWRLPTEAEWERAARGGLASAATAWGAALPPGEVPEGALSGPWRVGQGTPNGYGLFDMGTIVHEWCLDWYRADFYRAGPTRNLRGPAEGERRSSRGGSWRHRVRWSSPAARSSLLPSMRYADYGFRVLREVS